MSVTYLASKSSQNTTHQCCASQRLEMAHAAHLRFYAPTKTVSVPIQDKCYVPTITGQAVRLFLYIVFIAPGVVGHLSFTDILDTSLKVSWKEPQEKNGLLTGTNSNDYTTRFLQGVFCVSQHCRTSCRLSHLLGGV